MRGHPARSSMTSAHVQAARTPASVAHTARCGAGAACCWGSTGAGPEVNALGRPSADVDLGQHRSKPGIHPLIIRQSQQLWSTGPYRDPQYRRPAPGAARTPGAGIMLSCLLWAWAGLYVPTWMGWGLRVTLMFVPAGGLVAGVGGGSDAEAAGHPARRPGIGRGTDPGGHGRLGRDAELVDRAA